MDISLDTPTDLDQRIDAIEEAYEFMLAYAAQGRRDDQPERGRSEIRGYLEKAEAALDGFAEAARAALPAGPSNAAFEAYVAVVETDAARSRAALRLVLALPSISSQLVDNLNASIHLRALLTDLFLLDEALKTAEAAKPP